MDIKYFVERYGNPFRYGAIEELNFEHQAAEVGYTRKTTFYSDLSIAEWYGADSIKDTFNRVVVNWKSDEEYFTEFVMALNWKSWRWAGVDDELAELYTELYYKAYDIGVDAYEKDEKKISYFLRTLD